MAVGSIALYRDTNNSQVSPSAEGTWEGVTFNSQERADSPFTQNVNDIDVNITETGKYLCIYTIRAESTSTNRHTLRGRMLLNGSVVESGYGAAYSRGAGGANNQMYVMGHAILDVTAGEDVRIEWTNDGVVASDTLSDSKTSLMLVRLTDDSDVAYARYTDSTDIAGYGSQTWVDVPWDTTQEETRCAVIQKHTDNKSIKLKKAVRYLVKYTFMIDGNSRTQRIARATLGGTPVKQSFSYVYMRNPDSEFSCCVAMFIIDNPIPGQDLVIQVQRGEADIDGTAARVVNSSGLDIMELHSGAHTVITHDDTGGQNINPPTFVATNWARNVDQINSSSFTTSSITEIQVLSDGNYLFLANGISERGTKTDGDRLQQEGNWFVNSIESNYGGHGCFIRGLATVSGLPASTFNGGFNGAAILKDLNVGDDIDFRMKKDSGDPGPGDDDTNPDQCGFSALNLNLLIAPEVLPPADSPDVPEVVIILTSGSSWEVPPNFDNKRNYIELIGGGGGGGSRGDGTGGGAGGGGGGYSRINDFDTFGASSISFQIGSGGLGGPFFSEGETGEQTIWSGCTIANGGVGGSRGSGGPSAPPGGAGGVGNIFNGGAGGDAALGNPAGGAGGGGAGAPSGSGSTGITPGRPGSFPAGGAPGGPDAPIWTDTHTDETASAGAGGAGSPFPGNVTPGQTGEFYGGGGGGEGLFLTTGLGSGDGQQGLIVITYRSTLHAFDGTTFDEDNMKMVAFNQQLRSSVIDSDIAPGQLLRFVTLGPTLDGGAVMVDGDGVVGKQSVSYKLSTKIIDGDGAAGTPTFDFKLSSTVHDDDTLASRLHHIIRFRGRLLDDDKTKAFLNVITRFPSAIVDGDGGDNDGIVTGFVNFVGASMDDNASSHIILNLLRDIAFFINRDPKQLNQSIAIDDDNTYPDTTHGFRFVPINLEGTEFELIPIQINDEPDFTITIRLTEEDLRTMGEIE